MVPALKGLFYSCQDRALSFLVLQNRGLRPEPSACVTHVSGLCVTYVPGLYLLASYPLTGED